ncbi:protein of unknown function (plasmid) [Caballeronia sp. S22]
MRFRERLFSHTEAVPGAAFIAIVIETDYLVKCLMSYVLYKT